MLTSFKLSYPFNKTMSDYCRKSTNESIQKLTEKYNLERTKPKIKNPLDKDEDKLNFNFYGFLVFLSISTMAFFLNKRLK